MCNGIATWFDRFTMILRQAQDERGDGGLSLRAQRGNLVGVAMMVPRHVLNLIGIATWFDRLTMSGWRSSQ